MEACGPQAFGILQVRGGPHQAHDPVDVPQQIGVRGHRLSAEVAASVEAAIGLHAAQGPLTDAQF